MNIFEAIRRHGHDEDFDGDPTNQRFIPTDAAPGSVRKIEVMRYRATCGCPLWHPMDAKHADQETKLQHGQAGVPAGQRVVVASFQRRKAPAE